MSTRERRGQVPVGKLAWKCLKKNTGEVTTVAAVTVGLRILVFLPMLLCVDFGGKLPTWMGCVLCAVLYIGTVIPMRFWGREKLRRLIYSRHMTHQHKDCYKKWLQTGLLRYGRGILWGLPFLVCMAYFVVFYSRLDVKTFWTPIQSLAVLVGQQPNIGTGSVVALVLMTLFGLLFAYGWWRDLPFEYLPARSLGPVRTLHWSRRILKKHRKEMRKNIFVNFLLALPAWIGLGFVLVQYARTAVDFSLSPDMVLSQLLRLLRSPLPGGALLMLGGVVLFLYVPFWIFRKLRNTALIGTLMRENPHSSSRHSSPANPENIGSSAPAAPKIVDFHAGMGSAAPQNAPSNDWQADGDKDAMAQEAARRAREAAREAQEAAERAAQLAQDAARMAREAAESKRE